MIGELNIYFLNDIELEKKKLFWKGRVYFWKIINVEIRRKKWKVE